MCGRISLSSNQSDIESTFGISVSVEITAHYNIAPSSNVLCLVQSSHPAFSYMQWGLKPVWAKGSSKQIINARIESISSKTTFKNLVVGNRCCIIATGYFEWQINNKKKQPYYIFQKSKKPFAMAGLWSLWKNEEGEKIPCCTIVTRSANQSIHRIHHRMPAVLPPSILRHWLSNEPLNNAVLQKIESQDLIDLDYYAVSSQVNNPRNNAIECIKPL